MAFSGFVEGGFDGLLLPTDTWASILAAEMSPDFQLDKSNHHAMMRACRKGAYATAEKMLALGFDLETRLEDVKVSLEHEDLIRELAIFQAVASPAYLLAQHKQREAAGEHFDPVHKAFNLMAVCNRMASKKKSLSNKIASIRSGLREFTVRMLDLSGDGGIADVQLFLEQDSDIHGISVQGTNMLPRIYQAVELKHKAFVTHDNCQRVIYRAYYGDTVLGRSGASDTVWAARVIMQFLLTPLFSFCYMASKIGNSCRSKKRKAVEVTAEQDEIMLNGGQIEAEAAARAPPNKCSAFWSWLANNLEVPVNRMVSRTTWYVLFTLWVVIVASMHNRLQAANAYSPLQLVTVIWALAYMVADLQVMHQHGQTVTRKQDCCRTLGAKLAKFFANYFANYRMIAHTFLVVGLALEYFGYRGYSDWRAAKYKVADCSPYDASTYGGQHMVKVDIFLDPGP